VHAKIILLACIAGGGPLWGLFAPKDPGCIYGKVLDGHTGKVRCLSPEEASPPGPFDTPPGDAGADASGDASSDAAPALRADAAAESGAIPLTGAVSASIEGITFDGGEVPRVPAALERLKKEFIRCASVERGLTKGEPSIELRFLVRAPGKAEGVDVGDARGVSADVARCARAALAGRAVGAPSSDPVGVSFSVRFKRE
jgi:hypothetical protein